MFTFCKAIVSCVAGLIAIFFPGIRRSVKNDEDASHPNVVHYLNYSDTDEPNCFGDRMSDEQFAQEMREYEKEMHELEVARLIEEVWEKFHIILTREQVEEILDEIRKSSTDTYITAAPCPVYLRQTRNDHIVVGHTMRPQTASLATTVYRRQKVC